MQELQNEQIALDSPCTAPAISSLAGGAPTCAHATFRQAVDTRGHTHFRLASGRWEVRLVLLQEGSAVRPRDSVLFGRRYNRGQFGIVVFGLQPEEKSDSVCSHWGSNRTIGHLLGQSSKRCYSSIYAFCSPRLEEPDIFSVGGRIVKRISVVVGADHIDSLARARKPLLAVVELIWNALDADAKNVAVILTPNGLSGLESIQIEDDGIGISPDEFDLGFGQLGDSWKSRTARTKILGRALHGRKGVGRYRALSLGAKVVWDTRFESGGKIWAYEISFDDSDRRTVNATDPEPTTRSRGTIVTILNPTVKLSTVEFDAVKVELTEHFVLYLRQYPNIELKYDGAQVNPAELISRLVDIPFDFVTEDGQLCPQILTVIEWRAPLERALFLCSRDGFSFRQTTAGIQAPGIQFTAYLCSELLEKFEARNEIEIELGDLGKLLSVARDKLREYSSVRQAEQIALQVEEWKREEVYPYEGSAEDDVEIARRQVFDVVAQNVSRYLPDFKSSKKKNKQLTFNLL